MSQPVVPPVRTGDAVNFAVSAGVTSTDAGASDEVDWSWLNREDQTPEADLTGLTVTAVMVVHNGEDWLTAALQGLRAQSIRPTQIIAADAGSTDGTPEILALALADGTLDEVYEVSDAGFGLAVAEALEASEPAGDWLWLLHDDAAPYPDALAQLLGATLMEDADTSAPPAAFFGPMLLRPTEPGRPAPITGLGESIGNAAQVDDGLEPGEIDQRQHERHDVLGLDTCGLLIDAAAFDDLDGFDSELGVFRDGLALGWRANLAGYRCVVVPSARVSHLQAGRSGQRDSWVIGEHPGATERALSMILVNAHHQGARAVLSSFRLVASAALRALGYLLGKLPTGAADEWRAIFHYLGAGEVIRALRERNGEVAATAADQRRTRALRPRWYVPFTGAADTAARAISRRWRAVVGAGDSSSLDELTGGTFTDHGDVKSPAWANPVVVTGALLVLLSVVAGRFLIGPGRLSGPSLLPSQPDLGAAFAAYLHPIAAAPFQAASPWLGLTALASTLTVGQPELLITGLVFGAVALSFGSAWVLGRRIISSRMVRWAGAFGYALLLPMLGVLNQASVGAIVVAIMLPLLGAAGYDLWAARHTPGVAGFRPAFAAGLVLLVLVTVSPALVMVGIAGAACVCWLAPQLLRRVLVALGLPLLLLFPWLPSLLLAPGRFIAGPDGAHALTDADPASIPHGLGDLVLGAFSGAPWWLAVIFFASIALIALVAVIPRWSLGVTLGWVMAVLGTAMAVLPAGRVVRVGPGPEEARPETFSWWVVAGAGLLLVAVTGAANATAVLTSGGRDGRRRAAQELTARQRTIARAAVRYGLVPVAALGLLAGAGWWLTGSMAAPVDRRPATALPAFITNAMSSDAGVRTLALDLRGADPHWALLPDSGYRLGSADRGYTFGAANSYAALGSGVTARLLGANDESLVEDLTRLGVAYLWVQGGSEEQLAAIGNVSGLGAGSSEADIRIWTVPNTGARARVLSAGETVHVGLNGAEIPSGAPDRVLELAEPADARWEARLDGVVLPRVEAGTGRPTFGVGSGGGELTYRLTDSGFSIIALAQLIGLVAALIMAMPALRRRQPAPVAELRLTAAMQAAQWWQDEPTAIRRSRTLGDYTELRRLAIEAEARADEPDAVEPEADEPDIDESGVEQETPAAVEPGPDRRSRSAGALPEESTAPERAEAPVGRRAARALPDEDEDGDGDEDGDEPPAPQPRRGARAIEEDQ